MFESIKISDIGGLGVGLSRPECVLCKSDGTVFCSDARGGIQKISANGCQEYIGLDEENRFRSNGFALLPDGRFIFANTGCEKGIWEIGPCGDVAPFLLEINGNALGEPNFLLIAEDGVIWFSVMATAAHDTALSAEREDGYLARIKGGEVEIMTDRLNCANEFKFSHDGARLYINETFRKRTVCFDFSEEGGLKNRRVLAEYGPAEYPDGLTLDIEGHLWISCVVSNRILRVSPRGEIATIFDFGDEERIAEAESALANQTLSRDFIYRETEAQIQNPTSIAFGGPDMRTAYVGSLNHSELKVFKSPVAGVKPVHWDW